jgi:hypothetical protein
MTHRHPLWRDLKDAITLGMAAASAASPIRQGVMALLDRLQFISPAAQLDSVFALGTAMATSLGLDPHELVTRAKKVIPDLEVFDEKMNVVRDYTQGELRR